MHKIDVFMNIKGIPNLGVTVKGGCNGKTFKNYFVSRKHSKVPFLFEC